jgi:membrane-associated phospholipid phosphatase
MRTRATATAPTSYDPDTPARQHTLRLAATAAGSIALLATLVARLDADEQWAIDARVRGLVQQHHAPRTRATLRVAGRLGTVAVYGPATAIAMGIVASRRGAARAMPIGGAVAGAVAFGFLLKQLVCRPRPAGGGAPVNTHPSFPSGHATRATALASMLAYVAVRERVVAPGVAVPLAAGAAAVVGVSRAYADAHWTTDVVGGWAAGIAAMAVAALAYEHVRASHA